jgi:hypothetical protein
MFYMNPQLSAIIRSGLSFLGAFLLGHNIFGTDVNEQVWQEWVGILMGLISVVWSVLEKTATLEMFQGGLRQFVTFVGGFLVASGVVTGEILNSIMGLLTSLLLK